MSRMTTKLATRPNILFIMADDQGPWASGATGDPNAKTPNLDRLAGAGAKLTNYFCMSPVCSAARACLLTSLYSTETGISDFITPQEPESNVALEPGLATWPRSLMEAGYTTGHIGKWHLGSPATNHGYQKSFEGFEGVSKNPSVRIGRQTQHLRGYTTDLATDFAIEFIQRAHRKRQEPFLLSLHYFAPHANTFERTSDGDRTWLPLSDLDWNLFKDLDPVIPNPQFPDLDIPRLKRMTREYLASVHSVDRNVGRLVTELRKLGGLENTLIIFTSDNGYNLGHNGIWHKGNGWWILTNNRGDRPNLYDNSLRAPCIVHWPGTVPAGSMITETLSHLDWFPTFLKLTGASVPPATTLRGKNMLPLLKGEHVAWEENLFAQYSMWNWHQDGSKLRTFRTPQWKLIRNFRYADRDELYCLSEDPAENRNLIDSPDPQVQKTRLELDARLLTQMRSIDDPELKD